MTRQQVRVRIAPSPSGYLHVGTARMAIANYLFARHNNGKFLIRIEDTDASRSDKSLVEPILSALKWLGIESDEEIIYQSKRIDMYQEYAQKILEGGCGYRCFCSPEKLEKDRHQAKEEKKPLRYNRQCLNLSQNEIKDKIDRGEKSAIRIKIPDGDTSFYDIVGGELKRKNIDIEDFIIARSNGRATYNLAVVIDDHLMGITHVIRGSDHITNTFKQIHIYQALGFDIPIFGHLPLILRPDKKKVSKRLGDKDVAQYQAEGILPEAMFNFLCLLGWSPKTEREIYSVDELIEIFNPDYFNPSNAIFNEEKLEAFNKEHIIKKSNHELAVLVAPLLVEAGVTTKYWLETRWDYLLKVIGALKERVRRISDFVTFGGYFFNFDYSYDPEAEKKHFSKETAELLTELANRFEKLDEFTQETAEAVLRQLAEEKGVKRGILIHPARLALSGMPAGIGLYEMMIILTQPIVVERLRKAAKHITRY